jgi:fibronectin type 3 domain-containing protein
MIDSDFVIINDDTIVFDVPSECSSSLPLIIDPSLHFSTYIGGTKTERGCSVAVDPLGNVVIAGPTTSGNFPVTTGAYDVTFDGMDTMVFDAFIAKFDPTGSDLLACTFVGGDGSDEAHELAVDSEGNVYMTGSTTSTDFPTTPDALNSSGGFYLVKLNADLTMLDYGTFIPGAGSIVEIIHAPGGGFYIFGNTASSDLPTTTGAYCETYPGNHTPYVMRLDGTLKSITYCTYIGPGTLVGAYLDSTGSVYLAGRASNASFPLTDGAYNSTLIPGENNAFALKLNAAGSDLEFSTVLGSGSSSDIVTAPNGNSVVVGDAYPDFPLTSNALRDTFEESECFITILDRRGTSVPFSTFVGGDGWDYVSSVAWDDFREIVYISGETTSTDLPMPPGGFDQEYRGNLDMPNAYILGYNVSSLTVAFGTYIGGDKGEEVVHNGMCIDDDGFLYLAGRTWANNFPTTDGAYDTSYNGGVIEITDAFVTKFDPTFRSPPPMPTNLDIESFDETLLVKWDPYDIGNGRIFKHMVYRGRIMGNEAYYDETMNLAGYTDLNVVNGIRYYYRISAVNSVGESPLSPSTMGIPIGPPSTPLNITATTGNGSIGLNWTPPETDGGSPIQGYHIYKGVMSNSIHHYRTVGNVTGFFDDAENLDLGVFYFYKVQAYNIQGNGTLSQYIRVKPKAPPTPPQNFDVVPGDDKAVLSWSQPSSLRGGMLLGYYVWRVESGKQPMLIATLGPLALGIEDETVSNGVPYVYFVTAFTEVGESESSVMIQVIPFGLPEAPLGLSAVADDKLVRLTWDPPGFNGGNPVTKYVIGWGTSPGNLDMVFTIGNVTAFEHTELTNGVTYYYQIQAHNEAGSGPITPVVHATPMGNPGTVRDLKLEVTPSGIELTWMEPLDTGGVTNLTYRVLRGTTDDPMYNIGEVVNEFVYVDNTVTSGTIYYYRILVVTSVGEGPLMDPVQIIALGVPEQVTGFTTLAGNAWVELTWTAPDDGGSPIIQYVISRGVLETGLAEVGRVDGTVLNYTDDTAENGKAYYYRVFALNAIGPGSESDTVTASPQGPPPPPGVLEAMTGYKVYSGLTESDLNFLTELGDVTTYIDRDVREGQTYYYKVVATSESGDSEMSRMAKAKVQKEESPGFGPVMGVLALSVASMFMLRVMREGRDQRSS